MAICNKWIPNLKFSILFAQITLLTSDILLTSKQDRGITLHNRIINGALSLAVGLIALGGSGAISVHAASWHKGTPASLQGKWQTKWHQEYKNYSKDIMRIRTTISKRNVSSIEQAYHGPSDTMRPTAMGDSYKYLGNRTYHIRGNFMGTTYKFTAKRYSHNKIKITDHYETHYWYRY